MLITSQTANNIINGARVGLRQCDENGNDLGPVAPGDPARIVRFTDARGQWRFALLLKGHPRQDKYETRPNLETIWSAA